ncbi:MAG: hypothetical protein SF029_04660 [bacterium]|nr:hypothetical protein [bacterium]
MVLRRLWRSVQFRILVVVVVFTFALSVLIVTVSTQERLVQGAGFSIPDPQALLEEGIEIQPDTVDVFVIIPSFRITPPGGSGIDSSSALFTLDDIGFYTYDASVEQDADTVCIDGILMTTNYTDTTVGEFLSGVDLMEGVEPLCYDLGQALPSGEDSAITMYLRNSTRNSTTRDLYDSLYLQALSQNRLERYPYDHFTMQATLQFVYRVLDGEAEVNAGIARPYTVWLFETSGERNWNIEFVSETGLKDSPEDEPRDVFNFIPNGAYERITFEFARPLLFRLMYPFLIAAMLLIIGLLPFLDSLDGLMEVTAAILFGIFGLRQVMTLPNSQGQTILDVIFIGLYVVLAFTFLLIILTRGRLIRHEPESAGK